MLQLHKQNMNWITFKNNFLTLSFLCMTAITLPPTRNRMLCMSQPTPDSFKVPASLTPLWEPIIFKVSPISSPLRTIISRCPTSNHRCCLTLIKMQQLSYLPIRGRMTIIIPQWRKQASRCWRKRTRLSLKIWLHGSRQHIWGSLSPKFLKVHT